MPPPRLCLLALALPFLAAGCAEKDPKINRKKFLAALETYFADLNREMSREREADAPILHEHVINHAKYPYTKLPEPEEGDMPVAKRKAVYGPGDAQGGEAVEGALEATVTYMVITYRREEKKLSIPSEPVPKDPSATPEMVDRILMEEDDKHAYQPSYMPTLYRRGKLHFVYVGGALRPDEFPQEEPMTEEEKLAVIQAPEEDAAPK